MSPKGIIVVNKSLAMTSFQVVARLRKIFKLRRIGHCGTLDPFATGVLPLALGRATGAIQFMEKFAKTYAVLAVLGESRDTYDVEGQVTASLLAKNLQELYESGELRKRLARELPNFKGQISQVPPMFSALKYKGKALYKYAREGVEVEREPRQVQIEIKDIALSSRTELPELLKAKAFTLPQVPEPNAEIFLYAELAVSKGTYIRSWVHDLGEAIGTHAYATALQRTVCGPYTLDENCLSVEQLFAMQEDLGIEGEELYEKFQKMGIVRPLSQVFENFNKLSLTAEEALNVIQGKRIKVDIDRVELANHSEVEFPDLLFCYYQDQAVAVAAPINQGAQYLLNLRRVFAKHEEIR